MVLRVGSVRVVGRGEVAVVVVVIRIERGGGRVGGRRGLVVVRISRSKWSSLP